MENGTIVLNKNGRNYIKVDNSKWEIYAVYVAKQNPDICGKWFEGCEVHHKDLDRTNDEPSNLICLSKEEHQKIHRLINKERGIKVSAFKDGCHFGDFNTLTQCSIKTGLPITYISIFLKTHRFPEGKYDCKGWNFVSA